MQHILVPNKGFKAKAEREKRVEEQQDLDVLSCGIRMCMCINHMTRCLIIQLFMKECDWSSKACGHLSGLGTDCM